jgi:hypothetical protein
VVGSTPCEARHRRRRRVEPKIPPHPRRRLDGVVRDGAGDHERRDAVEPLLQTGTDECAVPCFSTTRSPSRGTTSSLNSNPG